MNEHVCAVIGRASSPRAALQATGGPRSVGSRSRRVSVVPAGILVLKSPAKNGTPWPISAGTHAQTPCPLNNGTLCCCYSPFMSVGQSNVS